MKRSRFSTAKTTRRDAADFKELVSEDACELGGDAVYAEMNGTGHHIRGTVLLFTEAK